MKFKVPKSSTEQSSKVADITQSIAIDKQADIEQVEQVSTVEQDVPISKCLPAKIETKVGTEINKDLQVFDLTFTGPELADMPAIHGNSMELDMEPIAQNTFNIEGFEDLHLNSTNLFFHNNSVINNELICGQTGKSWGFVPVETMDNIVKVHGKARLQTVLNGIRFNSSPEWILTDDNGLDALACAYPVDYFVYALFSLINFEKFLATKTLQQKAELKHELWLKMQAIDTDLIIQTSEHLRLVLVFNRPAAVQDLFKALNLQTLADTSESIVDFQIVLKSCLQKLRDGFYEPEKIAQREKAQMRFKSQKRLRTLSSMEIFLEESMEELNLFDFEDDLLPEVKFEKAEVRLGHSYKKAHEQVKHIPLKDTIKDIPRKNLFTGSPSGKFKFGGKK